MTGLPTRHVTTDVLEVAYHEAGPAGGQTVLFLLVAGLDEPKRRIRTLLNHHAAAASTA
ncbi:MAG: hypothetical protein ABW022_28385 [Actinoplanes sp.]